MKKLFTKSLMTAGVVGLMGLTSVAIAAEFNWYGSIRAGVSKISGDDKVNSVNLGSTGLDGAVGGGGVWGRIGVKASADLGNSQSVGGQVEIGVSDALSVRHQNVWIGGGWGKLTLGQQGNPYHSAANWDQSWMLGGTKRNNDGGSRLEGIRYSSNLGGPFSFNIAATGATADTDSIDRWIATAHYNFGVATLNVGINRNKADSVAEVAAIPKSYATETATISDGSTSEITVVVPAKDKVGAKPSYNSSVISVNGSAGGLDWYLAYEKSKANGVAAVDSSIVGLFLSYKLGGSGKIYLEHEKAEDGPADGKSTLLGYSHSLGKGVTFIAEHSNRGDEKHLNAVLKYDF